MNFRAFSNHFKMSGPRAENRKAESSDSCDNQRLSVTVQTAWSGFPATNYQESVEVSSKPRNSCMIDHKVYKRYGEKIYEGVVESYNVMTDKYKVAYGNGCFDEIGGDDIINYLLRHRYNDGGEDASPGVPVQTPSNLCCGNNVGGQNASPVAPAEPSKKLLSRNNSGGQNAAPSAPAQPSKKLPCGNIGGGGSASPSAPVQPSRRPPRRYASGKMTTGDANNDGRVRTRPLMMRAERAGGGRRPSRARKHGVKSSHKKTCANVNKTASRRVDRSSKRRLLCEEYRRSAYVYYSPGSDEDDEDPDWEE